MHTDTAIENLFNTLLTGDRTAARTLADELCSDLSPEGAMNDVAWPVLEMIFAHYRNDQLTTLAHNYAIRTLRQVVDQVAANYTRRARRNVRVCIFGGVDESMDLASQMAADMLEAAGFDVFFAGGGVANDEIYLECTNRKPNVLLLWAASGKDTPGFRMLIDMFRNNGGHAGMQIVCGGGIFNRVPGLAEEIGANVVARTPRELVESMESLFAPAGAKRATAPGARAVRRARAVA
ncbi:MAG: hypothetical protein FJ252_01715 [Phycisphaerae bacterium]|nr:hypothetical protein [Phycisphaerae bacterium]